MIHPVCIMCMCPSRALSGSFWQVCSAEAKGKAAGKGKGKGKGCVKAAGEGKYPPRQCYCPPVF